MTQTPELLSLVLFLEPLIRHPVAAENWYGFAAQGALMKALRIEGLIGEAQELHNKGPLKPYTVSTLFPKDKSGFTQ